MDHHKRRRKVGHHHWCGFEELLLLQYLSTYAKARQGFGISFWLQVDFIAKSYPQEKRHNSVTFLVSGVKWVSDIDSMHYEFLLN